MFCKKCGNEIDNGAKFCRFCGTTVDIPNQQKNHYNTTGQQQPGQMQNNPIWQETKEKKSPKGLIIAIIVVVLLMVIIGVGLLAYKLYSDNMIYSRTSLGLDGSDSASSDDYSAYKIEYVSCDVSAFPSIKVYFRVLDQYGDIVTLENPTFNINEYNNKGEAIAKTVKNLNQLDGKEGLSISLVADKSNSMQGRLSDMQGIMSQFVNSLDYKLGDRVELISFDTFVMYMCTMTDDINLLENGIYNMVTEGDTALYDALYRSLQSISLRNGARCVICFTDGQDNQSIYTAQEVAMEAQRLSIPIFIIGTDDADSGVLTSITDACGGMYWNISSISDVSEILNEIYGNEKDMYCVEYDADSSIEQYEQRRVDLILGDANEGNSSQTKVEIRPVKTEVEQQHTSGYEVVKADISWQDAHLEAMRRGGHLLTINSQSEMDEITQIVQDAGLKYVWMGGYTSVNNGVAFGHWVTGENFNDYTAWYEGEPSRNDLDGTPEMYLMLWYVGEKWSWNDQRNDPVHESGLDYFSGVTGYVIEYEY